MQDVLFVSKTALSGDEAGALLGDGGEKRSAGEVVILSAGEESITVEMPESPVFEVKVQREIGSSGSEVSVELNWNGMKTVTLAERGLSSEPLWVRISNERKALGREKRPGACRPELVPADASALQSEASPY